MNNHIDQLVQIEKYIKQAYANDVKGLVRLDLIMAIGLIQKLSMDLRQHILNLESEGEQPNELFNCRHMLDIQRSILPL
jgi:hypothetical protein